MTPSRKLGTTVICIAVLVMLLSMQAFASDKPQVQFGTLTGNNVNLRRGPGTGTTILRCMPRNTKMIVTGVEEGWYGVIAGGVSGYVFAEYLDVQSEGEGELGNGRVTGSVVNMRTLPGMSGKIVTRISRNTIVKLLGVKDGWYKVSHGRHTGYMTAEYILPVQSASASVSAVSGVSASETIEAVPDPDKEKAEQLLDFAAQLLGVRYVWGGSSPATGFDCSGFTWYVFNQCGYKITRTNQRNFGTPVSYANLMPGDLVFFSNNGTGVGHVGIYSGDGKFIHAPSPGKRVSYTTLESGYYRTHFLYARRIIPAD